jgi:hypothetical protein
MKYYTAYTAYTHSLSPDGTGRTWPRLAGTGCYRLRLLQLAAGPVRLTGGRYTPIELAGNHLLVRRSPRSTSNRIFLTFLYDWTSLTHRAMNE